MLRLRGLWLIHRARKEFLIARIFPQPGHSPLPFHQISSTFLTDFLAVTTPRQQRKESEEEEEEGEAGLEGCAAEGGAGGVGGGMALYSPTGSQSHCLCSVGSLWPVVSITFEEIAFVAIPIIPESTPKPILTNPRGCLTDICRLNLLRLPEITCTMAILQDLSARYAKLNKDLNLHGRILNYLQMYISQSLPFGRPADTNPENVHEILTMKFPDRDPFLESDGTEDESTSGASSRSRSSRRAAAAASAAESGSGTGTGTGTGGGGARIPAWKAHAQKVASQKLVFVIREYVKAEILDDDFRRDRGAASSLFCNGMLYALCSVSGYRVVTLRLEGRGISHLTVDECVWSVPRSLRSPTPIDLQFTPPNAMFCLGQYRVVGVTRSPVRGIFQMKPMVGGEGTTTTTAKKVKGIRFLLQLRTDNARYGFDYCDVEFPFGNRAGGKVLVDSYKFESHPGIIGVASNKESLTWKIGARFPRREVILRGIINFRMDVPKDADVAGEENAPVESDPADSFLVWPNMYLLLHYKILDETLSGAEIVSPGTRPPSRLSEVETRKEIIAHDVKIWNSRGDSRYTKDPFEN